MTKIFIIHAQRTGYGVINSLCSNKSYIFYAADTTKTPVYYSKYVKKFFLIPEITKISEKDFVEFMVNLATEMNYQSGKPIVFTGRDDYLQFFSRNSEYLGKFFEVSFENDISKLENALDKIKLHKIAEYNNVLTPKKIDFETDTIIDFPVIVKPAIKGRTDLNVVKEAFRINICYTSNELRNSVAKLEKLSQPYIIQEYIEGDDSSLYTIGTYSWKGDLLAYSTSKKIRQFPPNLGECSLGVTTDTYELLEPARKLLKGIGITGISQIEFKHHNGQFFLMEINPRIWSWHEIHRKVGVNFCQISINCLEGRGTDKIISPILNKKYSWHFPLIDLLHNNILHNNVSKFKIFIDFIRADCKAFFNYRDIMPFLNHFYITIFYIRNKLQALNKKII